MNESSKKNLFTEPELTVEDLSHALFEANRKLAATIEERNELFANISHDLRSPITAIHNAVEYLESGHDLSPEEIAKAIHLIHERTDALQSMINNIFMLTKLDHSDSSYLNLECIPCGPYLEDFFFLCEADSKYSKRELILDVPENFEYKILIDPNEFNRVLDNLFTNALNHTKEGTSISLLAKVSESNKDMLVISVKDNGDGIPQSSIPYIFDRSYKIDSSRTPSGNSGAGLGLSICKKIVELHGGTISCHSAPDIAGTEFRIKLPIAH